MNTDIHGLGKGLSTNAALSAMRTWNGGHPGTRINSRIRVSADPPDRQMPLKLRQLASLSQMRGAKDEAV